MTYRRIFPRRNSNAKPAPTAPTPSVVMPIRDAAAPASLNKTTLRASRRTAFGNFRDPLEIAAPRKIADRLPGERGVMIHQGFGSVHDLLTGPAFQRPNANLRLLTAQGLVAEPANVGIEQAYLLKHGRSERHVAADHVADASFRHPPV